jgi:hypothetical protein
VPDVCDQSVDALGTLPRQPEAGGIGCQPPPEDDDSGSNGAGHPGSIDGISSGGVEPDSATAAVHGLVGSGPSLQQRRARSNSVTTTDARNPSPWRDATWQSPLVCLAVSQRIRQAQASGPSAARQPGPSGSRAHFLSPCEMREGRQSRIPSGRALDGCPSIGRPQASSRWTSRRSSTF